MRDLTPEEYEFRIKELVREKTDLVYLLTAYRNMLGPKGLEVAKMWSDNRVRRVHYSWGPEAFTLTGEERAQVILDLESAPRTLMNPGEID